jgi:hypothetical protein
MGLLDDAIREHLDLKRRRGADPEEVARQENEALGPPRRGEFATPEDDAGVVPEYGDEPPVEDEALLDEPEELPAAVAGEPADDDHEPWPEEPATGEQATTEFTPDDADETPPRAAGEDVLEETPEFLQETPEHDRLWFEQRPPRDFDFDK